MTMMMMMTMAVRKDKLIFVYKGETDDKREIDNCSDDVTATDAAADDDDDDDDDGGELMMICYLMSRYVKEDPNF